MADHAQRRRLAAILTPRLLQEAFEGRIPWPKQRDLDFAAVVHWFLLGEFDVAAFRSICYPALQELSTVPMGEMPDLMQYLPPPEHPTFPLQAYGLLILLDQAPRMMLEGVDERWLLGFFDPLAVGLARRLVQLPRNVRPDTLQRWLDMGYTFDHWIVANLWFLAVFAHGEVLADHETMLELLAEMRAAVKKHTGAEDPYASFREETLSNPTSFLKAGDYGPPKGDDVPVQDYAYWMFMLYDSHYATLKHFGRVPFYNGALGREDTEEEKQFLASINRMGCVTPETEKHIRADIQAGRWTRLGG